MTRAECPILDLAVSSMALAVFSRTQNHSRAAMEASAKYHQLLQITKVKIPSLVEQNIDACLLAIFFMSRYENVVHHPSHFNLNIPLTMAIPSFSHHDGALAILKIWKFNLSHWQPATDVIKHTRRSMIKSALLRGFALPEWMLEGGSFGEHGFDLEYDYIIVRITNIRQRLSTLLKENTGSQCTSYKITLTTDELNEEVRAIDKALQDCIAHFPSTWCYQRHTLSNPYPWPTENFYSSIVYSYSSPAYAAVWNLYYATRMLINSTRLRVLEFSRPSSDDSAQKQRLECLFHMNSMANDLASSVPFCLQRFKVADSPKSRSDQNLIMLNTTEDVKPYVAGLIVWPLSIASSLKDVDVEQKLWFRSCLARLGKMVGDRVLECGESDQWLQL